MSSRPRTAYRGAWAALVALLLADPLPAQQESVVGTLHNLSASGPGEIRALDENRVCKFCHIPHNAVVPQPLWGHRLSEAVYTVPDIVKGRGSRQAAPQPDGSSRLCLSCHDGTVALGEVAGEPRPIEFTGPDRLTLSRGSGLGTDLTGSHPISFVLPDDNLLDPESDSDMGIRPLSAVLTDGSVPLDAQNKLQCTSCHDPHSDRYYQSGRVPHFWVQPTVDEVCLACHAPR